MDQFHFLWRALFSLLSVFIRRPQVWRSELNETPKSRTSWCHLQTLSICTLECVQTLPLAKPNLYLSTICLVSCFATHLSPKLLAFWDYFALTSGEWVPWLNWLLHCWSLWVKETWNLSTLNIPKYWSEKKKPLQQTRLNAFVNIIANSWFWLYI